jgi:teichuronic acid biosynthesis glycosyltransferase TuaG
MTVKLQNLHAPLISVIIPTYNCAELLREALDSVLCQSYANWEAIVINNFSADNTKQVVAGFSDSRISLFDFANYGVIAASRNYGISFAKGEYVAFLDSDDLWRPEKLKRCMETLQEHDKEWICNGERWFGDGIDKDVVYGPAEKASFDQLLFRGNCISTSAVVVKLEKLKKLGGFKEHVDIVTAEDYDLWLRLARSEIKIIFINEILGSYRIHPNGHSRAAIKNMQATTAVVESFFSSLPASNLYEKLKRRARRGSLVYGGARALQNNRNHAAAWPLFFRALWLWPFDKRLLPAMCLNLLGLRF